jgi:pimeloyl-ACP methyl ester carboxylesterase
MGWLRAGSAAQWAFSRIGRNDSSANAHAICGRSLAQLALSEAELRAIRVPVLVLVGEKDDLIRGLYIEPLKKVGKDWPVVEIPGGDHITCILKPEFRDEMARWLTKNRGE